MSRVDAGLSQQEDRELKLMSVALTLQSSGLLNSLDGSNPQVSNLVVNVGACSHADQQDV